MVPELLLRRLRPSNRFVVLWRESISAPPYYPKTNSRAVSGAPDATDWVTDCAGQARVHPAAVRMAEILRTMIWGSAPGMAGGHAPPGPSRRLPRAEPAPFVVLMAPRMRCGAPGLPETVHREENA